MNRYQMEVVTQVITIDALSQDDAENKYNTYFNEEPCPCGADECDCVEDSEDTYHNTELVKENI